MQKRDSLNGKVIAITGAAGVLCSGFAKMLARQGAKIALLDINLAMAQKFADEIAQEGFTALAVECNVLDKASCLAAAQAVKTALGSCDMLINGAGGNNPRATTDKEYFYMEDLDSDVKTFFDLEDAGVGFVFNLNFLGTLLPTQAFAQQMLGRKGASIINISSMNSFTPLTKIPAYSGAKAAISNFTQWLAVHFSKVGIRVNAIAPGFFITTQNEALLLNEDGTPTARAQKVLAATPMDRFGAPEELWGAVSFLLDEQEAGFITGIVLPIDGGFSAYSGV